MHSLAGASHEAMLLQTLPTVVADDFDEGEIRDCDSDSETPATATGDADISMDATDRDGPSIVDSANGSQSVRCAKSFMLFLLLEKRMDEHFWLPNCLTMT